MKKAKPRAAKPLTEAERKRMVAALWADGKQRAFDFDVAEPPPAPVQRPRPLRRPKRKRVR